jgi:YqxM protein
MKQFIVRFALMALLSLALVGRVYQVASLDTFQAQAQVDPDWDRSSLLFDEEFGCQNTECGEIITARVCNGAQSEPMDGTTSYEVYYIATGNPKDGSVVATGTINALGTGECQTLTYDTNGVAGNYMFRAIQRPGHPGTGELWSEQCEVNSCNETDPSPTPSTSPEPSSTPSVGGGSCAATSLANDNLQCNVSGTFDAVMDVKDANGNGAKDVLVKFRYNGQTAEARTNENGRAKVSFKQSGNGPVYADPEGCTSQAMYINTPNCPAMSTPSTTGQVLGATTLAETGSSSDYLAVVTIAAGAAVLAFSVNGYRRAQ